MSLSPSNWQQDIQGIPRRAREHLHHPPALPQEGWQGGSSFLKVYLLLSSCWTSWGLPSAHVWAAHLPNAIIPWGKNSVTQMYFAVCFPLSYKAFDYFFFGASVSSAQASVYVSLSNQALKCKCLAKRNQNMHEQGCTLLLLPSSFRKGCSWGRTWLSNPTWQNSLPRKALADGPRGVLYSLNIKIRHYLRS